jgi:hypothetical protein
MEYAALSTASRSSTERLTRLKIRDTNNALLRPMLSAVDHLDLFGGPQGTEKERELIRGLERWSLTPSSIGGMTTLKRAREEAKIKCTLPARPNKQQTARALTASRKETLAC